MSEIERVYGHAALPDGYDGWDYSTAERVVESRETKTHLIETVEIDEFAIKKSGKARTYVYTRKWTTRSQLMLCIGGPLNGQRKADRHAQGYVQFNNSHRSRGKRISAVLIWEKDLRGHD